MDKRWKSLFLKKQKTSLDDVKKILETLPFKKSFKIINVVGTNGKGSVSNYLAQGLESQGFKVGLFTSPHIYLPNERIKVNNKSITDKEFFNIYKLLPKNLHFFAYLTLVALQHFHNQKCDYVILEAGIGGLKDTTNIIDGDFGLVTSISLDHEQLLGNTLTSIAKNKAGIINENMIFIVPSSLQKFLRAHFKNYFLVNNDGPNYQIRNQKLASESLKKWFDIDFDKFQNPLARSEKFIHNGFLTWFDVAHNIDGINESLKLIGNKFKQVVICSKKNKSDIDFKNIFNNKKIYYYQPSEEFKKYNNFLKVKNINDFYKKQNQPTLYIGSFYLIGDIYEKPNKKD